MLDCYCRLCAEMRPKSDLLEITTDTTGLTLEEKIFQCFQLQIEIDGKLPHQVCSNCCAHVVSSYEFSQKIQNAQQILWKLLNQFADTDKLQNNCTDLLTKTETECDFNACNTISNDTEADCVIFKNETNDIGDYAFESSQDANLHTDSGSDLDDVPLSKRIFPTPQVQQPKISDSCLNRSSKENKKICLNKRFDIWKEYKFGCVKCETILTSIKDLKNHYEDVHNQSPIYKCMECPKVKQRYELFAKHVRAHRNKHKYKCDICGKYSYKRSHHDRHLEVHSKVCKYMCSTCGKSFKTQGSLYSHSRVHLPTEIKNKHKCDICDKHFSSAPNLASHKKIHSGIKEYTCEQCGKNFTQKTNLDQHFMSQHTTESPFQCNMCPRAFKTIYRLKSHQTLHSTVRPFKCETCGKTFREKGMMKAHTKIHSTEYPFECSYCKKSFKLKAFLKSHLRQHTGERPYSCEKCDHHFTNWSNYSKHMRGRHGIDVKSATTHFLQQQRLQLMQQEQIERLEDLNNESTTDNLLKIEDINLIPS